MQTIASAFVAESDRIKCSEIVDRKWVEVEIVSNSIRLAVYFSPATIRRLHRAVGDYLEGPDGSTDRADICRPDPGAESPESLEFLSLEELKDELTGAASAVGIDPDGMTDLDIIRALVRRATDRKENDPVKAASDGSVCEMQVCLAHEAVAEWDGQDDDDLVLLLRKKFGRKIRGSEFITTPVPAEGATVREVWEPEP